MEAPSPRVTVPCQIADEKTVKSMNQSFAGMSAQEDMLTPRAIIEGFLATAVEDDTTPEVFKRPATSSTASKVFRISDQPESYTAPRTLASSNASPSPGSRFTPRTNIFNLIHYTEDTEQTPLVRGDYLLEQASSETGVSASKLPEWGQEVNLSPMYLPQTSFNEEQEDSPSTVKQAFKRPRRSFHIPLRKTVLTASKQTSVAAEENPVVMGLESGGLSVAVSEDIDVFASNSLVETEASPLDNFDDELGTHLTKIHMSTLENFDGEVGTHLEGRHISAVQNVDPEAQLDLFLPTDLGLASSLVPEKIDAFVDGGALEQNIGAAEENVEAADENVEAAEENVEAADENVEAADENVEAAEENVEEELLIAGSAVGTDVNTENTETSGVRFEVAEEHDEFGSEAAEDNAGVEHKESSKEKNFRGSRTLLTSKHGKISYSCSPNRMPKDTPAASTPSSSVYDLSESSSSSSGDIHITKQKSSGPKHRPSSGKSSGKRGIGSAKSSKQNISFGLSNVSRNKSNLSYSEWKSLQRGRDTTGLDSHYPLSSTPFDRRKKIFHSTRIHHSVHANEDAMLEAQMTDSIPNISPIRPVAKNQTVKRTRSGQKMAGANTATDIQDGIQEVCMRGDRGGGSQNQERPSAGCEEDSSDDDFPGFSPLATPHVDMDKRSQEPAAIQKSVRELPARPQPSGSGQKDRKEKEQTSKPPRKRAKTSSDTALPRRSVKFFAERHSTMKLSKDAVEEIEKASEIFWDNTFKALETFALHAGRKIVKEEDVVLLMKTQRLIKDTEDLHDAIRQFLPMELRSELIPMAKP